MIGPLWHGWTNPRNDDAYEEPLRSRVLPAIDRLDGHERSFLLRRERDGRVEFVTLTLWESLDAVRAFAGDDYEVAVVPPEAQALLDGWDRTSAHYDVRARPR